MAIPELVPVSRAEEATDGGWDAVVVVSSKFALRAFPELSELCRELSGIDARLHESVSLHRAEGAAGGRVVLAPTGPLDRDHDDVRRFGDAARAGIARARDAGARQPLLVVEPDDPSVEFARAFEVALLETLAGLWQPLEAREARGEARTEPVTRVGVWTSGDAERIARVRALELGRRLSRDLGGTEPERMAPPRFAQYCRTAFEGTSVQVRVEDDPSRLEESYPLLSAVARASLPVERHRPRVIRLEWEGEGPIHRTIFLAGKAVCYDTGGADIKAGGHMAGMSRDKGGGASVAGFVKAICELAPKGVRVVAEIGAVRNSVGAEGFVSDEIITGHSGVRVRIGNTDAEGRLVLADLLSHLREEAASAPGPELFSVATLTGHSGRAVGPYSIALDNGPARDRGTADRLGRVGDLWGDPFEVSRLRREDFDFVRPRSAADDVLSSNNLPSTGTARGHQFPMAFLSLASGLDRHGRRGNPPLPYTHVDIGGSYAEGGDWQHGRPTAAPVVALAASLIEG